MDSFKGQGEGGIQMLLTAEQEAQHIVSSARNMKMARLKQAKEEAEKEVALYRSQMEVEYQNKISESTGSSRNTVKKHEEEIDRKIKALTKSTTMVSKEVVDMLIEHITIRVGAMAADEGNVKIEKFDGTDFGFWKMQIEDFLYHKNLYQPLSGKQPEGIKNEDWALLDRQALGVIRLTLSRNVAFNIAKEKTTAGLMAALSNSWNATVTAVSSSSGNSKLKFNDGHISTPPILRNHGELSADADGKSNLWHQRLGHMSKKRMKTLFSKGKLLDLKNVDVGLCEDCIFGKQKKVSFAKIGKTPKAEKLKLVHIDVWGPSPVPSLAGSLYYVTFIDDSTRKVWVYFLKKKSKVFDTFRKWKAMVENETGLKVKRLRSDNGGEYRNRRFRDFCANNGIKMETTIPMTPQQNGVAERMNRTLNERARSMRIHVGLPKFLWVEAINTAAYMINYSAKRSKLDAKSNKCAFVGYGGDEFGYRFWDYENQKIIRSRDVIFNENISPEGVQEELGTPELRRSSRIPKLTQRYSPSLHYLLLTDNGEPECYDEAMQVEDSVKWESSMKDEMDSLMSNQTWELAELPPGKKALHNKLVLKIVAAENLHLEQLDVKTAFLHGSDMQEIIHLKQELSKQFAMKDLGAAKQILGMRIKRDTNSGVHFRLSKEQSPKTEEERAHMVKVSYTSVIKSLMYAMVCTRPDIAHAVGAVSMYMNNPGKVHWEAVKWILKYLRAGNVDIRKSITGYIYTLGGTAVSWVSQLQKIVSLSTTKAELSLLRKPARRWFGSKVSWKS
ncbi:V-type proton ATPase subunit G3 [Hibiscus syriacus]|uniref:V-type proton ATPase subunit G3 n=1 Tax=Hibiscus syriacus TaxID=106335 RepID=A0A6A3BVT5_HIBSY|nr:V-type proton ATPase subunit G3 [Hibiscus syriacus]